MPAVPLDSTIVATVVVSVSLSWVMPVSTAHVLVLMVALPSASL